MKTTVRGACAVVVAALAAAAAPALADESAPATDLASASAQVAADGPPPPPAPLFSDTFLDRAYDDVQAWKKEHGLPLQVGALHLWHRNRNSPHATGYGVPGTRGTLMYYAIFDPAGEADLGWGRTKVGAHVEARFRDHADDRFRPWFESNLWLWEAYGWADTDLGRLKAGKVWKRYGFDWDGCWFGTLAFYSGFKLDPDWGVSLENKTKTGEGGGLETFLQYFVTDDEVNGSASGADAESDPDAREKHTFVARGVWTTPLGDGAAFITGVSAMSGQTATHGTHDEHILAGAFDATWVSGPARVFGEVNWEHGVMNRAFALTGGPTDARVETILGATYQVGPVTLRAHWSSGRYQDPDGKTDLYLVGTTVAVTKNVDVYLEYVRWNVHPDGVRQFAVEDGFQFLVNWRF